MCNRRFNHTNHPRFIDLHISHILHRRSNLNRWRDLYALRGLGGRLQYHVHWVIHLSIIRGAPMLERNSGVVALFPILGRGRTP